MSELFSKALYSGLGLASLTKDAIQKTAEELVNQSKISEEEGRRLVKDLHKRSNEAQKTMEKKVQTAVNSVLKSLNLAIVKNQPKKAKAKAKPVKKTRKHK